MNSESTSSNDLQLNTAAHELAPGEAVALTIGATIQLNPNAWGLEEIQFKNIIHIPTTKEVILLFQSDQKSYFFKCNQPIEINYQNISPIFFKSPAIDLPDTEIFLANNRVHLRNLSHNQPLRVSLRPRQYA